MSPLADPAEAFRPLPRYKKARLVLEILTVYTRVRWSLIRTNFQSTLGWALRQQGSPPPEGRSTFVNGLRLGGAVARTLALLPTDSRCLVRSVVLTAMLSRRGIESSLVIGVRRDPEFEAHAWVELNGAPLLPDQGYEQLVELTPNTPLP